MHQNTYPWLIITRENTQVGTADKVIIIQWKDGISRVQEFWMEHNLDAVRRVVEELDSSNLSKNRVIEVVGLGQVSASTFRSL